MTPEITQFLNQSQAQLAQWEDHRKFLEIVCFVGAIVLISGHVWALLLLSRFTKAHEEIAIQLTMAVAKNTAFTGKKEA